MATETKLTAVIEAKDNASAVISNVGKNVGGLSNKIKDLGPVFKGMAVAGTVAFGAITAVAYSSIKAYAEVERANRQLEHAVIGVSKGTEEQVKQINSVVEALEKKAGVDADSLKMGVAQLSTFGLQTDSVIGLTKSLADFTVNQDGLNASSDQYITSANTIAKALKGQFGLLEKQGIRFTEAQRKMIEFGTEAQKVAAINEGFAQNLRETTDTVGGVDLAMAKLQRTQENISENIGKALAPAFTKVLETLQPLITKFAEWADKNPELLAKIIMIGGAVAALVAVVGTLGVLLPAIIAGFALLAGPLGIVVAIIVALIPTVMLIIQLWPELVATVKQAFENIGETILAFWEAFKTNFNTMFLWIKVYWQRFKQGFIDVWDAIKASAKAMIDAVTGWLDPIIKTVEKLANKIASIASSIGGAVKNTAKGALSELKYLTGIDDGIVQNGKVITTHPDDYIMAAKDPSMFGGGGKNININISGAVLTQDAARMMGDEIINQLRFQLKF